MDQIRVIIADDEPSLRELLARRFRKNGFHVDTASDAEQAMELLRKHNGAYDVVVLDDVMPSKRYKDRVAEPLTREIKSIFPSVQVIVISGWGPNSALEAIRAGAYRYIAKPFDTDELIVTIKVAAEAKRISPIELSIFLCHSSSDKPKVRELYERLSNDGFTPWLDETNLLPGQDWQQEIPKAVRKSDIVLVCLSQASINKTGYVQKEIRYALDVADEQPERAIFIIPLKLEECDVPERLRKWQWVNLFADNGYDRLIASLKSRADAKAKTRGTY